MRKKIILINAVPFVVGFILDMLINLTITTSSYTIPTVPFVAIAVAFLVVWALLAAFVKKQTESRKTLLLSLLAVPLAVLVLCGLQSLLGGTWPVVGIFTEVYFLPVQRLASRMFQWVGIKNIYMFPVRCVAFLLMAAAALVGCKLKKK